MASVVELGRPFRLASVPRRMSWAESCTASSLVLVRVLRMVRGLVGVTRGSPSPLVIMVPGRPRTAAALTGVPLRIACIIGLILSRELGVGMREGRGTNARYS